MVFGPQQPHQAFESKIIYMYSIRKSESVSNIMIWAKIWKKKPCLTMVGCRKEVTTARYGITFVKGY